MTIFTSATLACTITSNDCVSPAGASDALSHHGRRPSSGNPQQCHRRRYALSAAKAFDPLR